MLYSELDRIRSPLLLNGEWLFREDLSGTGNFADAPEPEQGWRKVCVPSDVAGCIPERPDAVGVYWYSKTFRLDKLLPGKRTVLHFDAVNYEAAVFLNGRFVVRNEEGFLPFEADVTNTVREGENLLAVRVCTRRRPGQLPTAFYWKNCGGILRDVYLYQTDVRYIASCRVTAHADGTAAFAVQTVGEGARLEIALFDPEGQEILRTEETATRISPVSLWSPETPALYRAEVMLKDGDAVLDRVLVTYGYRDIEARDGEIMLNGKPIFLQGFNRHEDHPRSGGAACAEVAEEDFARMKSAGANFVRMCHYPHDERELAIADRIGLCLLVEIPLCGYLVRELGIGIDPGVLNNEEVYGNARRALIRMIARDHNHPSVIIWSVGNENNETEEKVVTNFIGLLSEAKRQDPSRLCTHVSCYSRNAKRKTFFTEDDVICVNTYPSIQGRISEKNREFDFARAGERIEELFKGLKEDFPGKPVLLTEFGYRTNDSFDGALDEEMQSRAIAAEFKAAKRCTSGAAVWLFADHLWQTGCGLLGDVSDYGLLTRDRREKAAWKVYRDLLQK